MRNASYLKCRKCNDFCQIFADVINMIVVITVGLKRPQECIKNFKMHHFGENTKFPPQTSPPPSAPPSASQPFYVVLYLQGVCKYYIGPAAACLCCLPPPPPLLLSGVLLSGAVIIFATAEQHAAEQRRRRIYDCASAAHWTNHRQATNCCESEYKESSYRLSSSFGRLQRLQAHRCMDRYTRDETEWGSDWQTNPIKSDVVVVDDGLRMELDLKMRRGLIRLYRLTDDMGAEVKLIYT